MNRAILPGTFDPFTNGHLDILQRAIGMFDVIIIAVAPSKKQTVFTLEERIGLIKGAVKDVKRVEVASFEGLLMDYVRRTGARAVIRGLRAISDFEYEFQMALMNRRLDPEVETVFLMPSLEYTFLSSSIIKEVAYYGGCVTGLVPANVEQALKEKYKITGCK